MLNKSISLLLVTLLLLPAGLNTTFAQTTEQKAQEEKLRKKVVEWGTNKNVNLKLRSGEKLKGRLAEINNDFFTVQFVEQGNIRSREVRFSEVKKISEPGKAGDIVAGVAIGALAAIGVVATVVLVAIAASN